MSAAAVILTVADHDQNGFVALAQWSGLTEEQARAFIERNDEAVSDDMEPGDEASHWFILDLMDGHDCIDNGKRFLPTQTAMALAPDQVRQWLEERPDPNSTNTMRRAVPEAARSALSKASANSIEEDVK